jgi:hypothetical protein
MLNTRVSAAAIAAVVAVGCGSESVSELKEDELGE